MLNLKLTDNVNPQLKSLVMELNRTHVSRFPIDVDNREDEKNILKFVDSRFPSKAYIPDSCIALLSYDGKKLVLESTKITNDKYKCNHDLYHTKATADSKKMLKLLKQYIKPYTMGDVSSRTHFGIRVDIENWVKQPHSQFLDMVNPIGSHDVAKEIMYLKNAGVEFHTEKFRQVAAQGLDLYNEGNRRKSVPSDMKHVFFNPDGTVEVSSPYDKRTPNFSGTYFTAEETPKYIQQAVAILRMVSDKDFVPEVGKRISEREFWVLEQK